MAKALFVRTYHVAKSGNKYVFTGDALIEDGQGDAYATTVSIESTSFAQDKDLLKSAWRAAIINKAAEDYSVTVDEVMFPNFEV